MAPRKKSSPNSKSKSPRRPRSASTTSDTTLSKSKGPASAPDDYPCSKEDIDALLAASPEPLDSSEKSPNLHNSPAFNPDNKESKIVKTDSPAPALSSHISGAYVRTIGLKASFDCRKIQIFGIDAAKLKEALDKKIVSPEQLATANVSCISHFPSRIVIRRGTIDNVLDAIDLSTFDVAMFFSEPNSTFEEFNVARRRKRAALHKAMDSSIVKQTAQATNSKS